MKLNYIHIWASNEHVNAGQINNHRNISKRILGSNVSDGLAKKQAIHTLRLKYRIYASAKYVIIDPDNDLSPVRRQVIIWTDDDLLAIRY